MDSVVTTAVIMCVGCVASLIILALSLATKRILSIVASIALFLYFVSYPLFGYDSMPLAIVSIILYLIDLFLSLTRGSSR